MRLAVNNFPRNPEKAKLLKCSVSGLAGQVFDETLTEAGAMGARDSDLDLEFRRQS
jgi:hypothetical protein